MTNSVDINEIHVTDNTILFNLNLDGENKIAYGNSTDELSIVDSAYSYNTQGVNLSGDIDKNILPLYDPLHVFHKSAIYKLSKSIRTGTTLDYQNIFSHLLSSDMSSAIQIDNVIYELEPENEYGRITLPLDIYQMISTDNGRLFDDPNLISVQTFKKSALSAYDGLNAVLCSYVGIKHNMIYEMPGSIENDFDSGSIAANSIKGKNSFNSLYSNQHDSAMFSHTRQYLGIGRCGTQVFARYYDNVSYLSTIEGSPHLEMLTTDSTYGNLHLLHIEVISEINRFLDPIGHKSGLYSLVIDAPALTATTISDEKVRANIKLEVQNCVRNIIEKLHPAQTQLNQIYIK